MNKLQIFTLLLYSCASAEPLDSQLFIKGDEISFYPTEMTTGRRTEPRSQLAMKRDSIHFIPEKVTCTYLNKEKWDCIADLPEPYIWGKLNVDCEGYHHSKDTMKLRGSCQLQYAIVKAPTWQENLAQIIIAGLVVYFSPWWVPPAIIILRICGKIMSSRPKGSRGHRRPVRGTATSSTR